MRLIRFTLISSMVLSTAALPAFATRARRGPTSHLHTVKKKPKPSAKKAQTSIDAPRATEIQTALIKAGYMTGSPSGQWDATSESAMKKLQADNGWQTKLTPDSRALIKLGLGPKAEAGIETDASTTQASLVPNLPSEVLPSQR
jgi:HAMP domain-containing protein